MIFTVQINDFLGEWAKGLNSCRQRYADHIGVEYKIFKDDDGWVKDLMSKYPQFTEYDAINFYKHWVMRELADTHDKVCYMDFDCFPNTKQSVFDHKGFWSGGHMFEGEANRVGIKWHKKSTRSRTAKYWHSYAMCMDTGIHFNKIVYNTGFMIANSGDIKKLDYFGDFDGVISLMEEVKADPFFSPRNQIFAYDNETMFNYLSSKNNVGVKILPYTWHSKGGDGAEVYHLYGKKKDFSRYESILC